MEIITDHHFRRQPLMATACGSLWLHPLESRHRLLASGAQGHYHRQVITSTD